jgi:hypothetical protein
MNKLVPLHMKYWVIYKERMRSHFEPIDHTPRLMLVSRLLIYFWNIPNAQMLSFVVLFTATSYTKLIRCHSLFQF